MTLNLPETYESFVAARVAEGDYASPEEVVKEALRLLQARDREAKLADLREAVRAGFDAIEAGDLHELTDDEILARCRARVGRESRDRESQVEHAA